MLFWLLCATMGAALWFGAAAPPAQAGTATLGTELYLTQHPQVSMPSSCRARHFYLAAGYFDWTVSAELVNGNFNHLLRYGRVFLGTGHYTWTVCLHPSNGTYQLLASLNPDNPRWYSIFLPSDYFRIPVGGRYRYLSQIRRLPS